MLGAPWEILLAADGRTNADYVVGVQEVFSQSYFGISFDCHLVERMCFFLLHLWEGSPLVYKEFTSGVDAF